MKLYTRNLGDVVELPTSFWQETNPAKSPVIDTDGMSDDALREFGWLPVQLTNSPEPEEGYRLVGYSTPFTNDGITAISTALFEQIPEPSVIIPESVSMRQARLILLQYGILDQIDAAVKTLGGTAEIEWEYASEVRRDNPLVGAMYLSESELDAMFLAASKL